MSRSNYRILGLIGTGQFGRVYSAINRKTGELVALKDLDQQKLPTHLFLREVRLLLTLKHPNIVSCQGLEYHSKGRYLVMDYCEGGTLRDLMENPGKLSLLAGLQLIEQVLLGLVHAHQQNIIHCDLKPENILLSITHNGWIARITDFGIARITQELDLPVGLGDLGSPAYMAPERYYGQYGYGSDLYAVGVMLYELVMGDRPFSGIPGEIMHQHLNKPVILPDTLPDCLKTVILSSLQKLASRRFSTAEEMLNSLRLAIEFYQNQEKSEPLLSFMESIPEAEDEPIKTYQIIAQKSLEKPVIDFALDSENIYLGMIDRIACYNYNYTQQWSVKLSENIRSIKLFNQSCLVVLKNYAIYQLNTDRITPKLEPVSHFNQAAKNRLISISPQKQWLAVVELLENSHQPTLEILSLPDFKPLITPIKCRLFSKIIAVDNRYGLGFFVTGNQTTINLFTRKGLLFEVLKFPLAITKITPSLTDPCCIFALEYHQPNRGVLINLKPFKIQRIVLEIEATLIVAIKEGFLLANNEGKMIIFDLAGQRKAMFEIQGRPTAIASLTETDLFLTTWLQPEASLLTLKAI